MKYKILPVIIRITIMGIPAIFCSVFEYLYDKTDDLLIWLDRKLPDPVKEK